MKTDREDLTLTREEQPQTIQVSKLIQELVDFLRGRRREIVRDVKVKGQVYDPTYGNQSCTQDIEVVDFDSLLKEMDNFAESFVKAKPEPEPDPEPKKDRKPKGKKEENLKASDLAREIGAKSARTLINKRRGR